MNNIFFTHPFINSTFLNNRGISIELKFFTEMARRQEGKNMMNFC
jgi:hypothetical protein